jgi:hypothetical protein
MKNISHQLKYLRTDWKVKHLFLGTFNPEGGKIVPYYYAREKNLFWNILSHLFQENFNPYSADFFELLHKHGIACIDMIQSLEKIDGKEFSNQEKLEITGKGYSDSKIINGKIRRNYNTKSIKEIIALNNCNVYSTWGKGSNLKDWRSEVDQIKFNAHLVSPSPVARVPKGVKKYDYIFNDWREKIII